MNVKFKDCPISINGVTKHATSASIAESMEMEAVRSLGVSSSAGNWPSNKPRGTFSASYLMTDSDLAVRNLTGVVPVSGNVGGLSFVSGFLSSYSVGAEPNSLVEASVSFDFFQKIEELGAFPSPPSGVDYAHGSESYPSSVFFNDNLFRFEYNISQSVTPYFYLGENSICAADLENGSVTVTLEGSGLGGSIEYPCPSTTSVGLSLRDICGNSIGEIQESGLKIRDSELSVTNDDGLVGKITLEKAY
jgi:hypothetical protein